jgi:isoquinoline 1-oxidoreductase beta subunit
MTLQRRQFVLLAGSGLTLGLVPSLALPQGSNGTAAPGPAGTALPAPAGASTTMAAARLAQPFVRIDSDGSVTVMTKHLEMGQGIASGLATVLADALDADWQRVRTESAPVNPALYKNLVWGQQTTGGSTSMANSWLQLREAGWAARTLLLQAAAQQWEVALDTLSTEPGQVLHAASGRRLGYGALAAAAGRLPLPAQNAPPAPSRLVGQRGHRLDVPAIVRGAAVYGMDMQRPGQRVAVILRPPLFGALALNVDDQAALQSPGVLGVHRVPQGVAVVAKDTWSAIRARALLQVRWDETAAEKRSSADLRAEFKRLADAGQPGADGLQRGDTEPAFAAAAQVLQADFEFPYLAHAAMEPLSATVEMVDGVCHLWAASQNPQADHAAVMRLLNLPADKVLLHGLPTGGSFGRRATFSADWVTATLQVFQAHGMQQPLKLVWTREDDMQGGFYRPMALHRMRAALGSDGRITALEQTIVCQSFLFPPPKPGVAVRHDPTATEGHLAARYDVPAARLRWVQAVNGVPVQMYRALSHNHSTFSKEVLMDELARAAGQDALAFRLAHLQSDPGQPSQAGHLRQAAVLRQAAAIAGWGRPLPPGRALGLAVQEAYKTFVAQVAQVRIQQEPGDKHPGARKRIVVERVVCVVDCGIVVNPDTVRAQMEGGIVYGLTQALHSEITLSAGRVQQSNFQDAPVLRLHEMPVIEVHIIESSAPPTGVGEPGSVPVVAAVANAITVLTGKPVRSLPLRLTD